MNGPKLVEQNISAPASPRQSELRNGRGEAARLDSSRVALDRPRVRLRLNASPTQTEDDNSPYSSEMKQTPVRGESLCLVVGSPPAASGRPPPTDNQSASTRAYCRCTETRRRTNRPSSTSARARLCTPSTRTELARRRAPGQQHATPARDQARVAGTGCVHRSASTPGSWRPDLRPGHADSVGVQEVKVDRHGQK